MATSSPSLQQVGRLRGLRGARRVWSSDEEPEDETNRTKATAATREVPIRTMEAVPTAKARLTYARSKSPPDNAVSQATSRFKSDRFSSPSMTTSRVRSEANSASPLQNTGFTSPPRTGTPQKVPPVNLEASQMAQQMREEFASTTASFQKEMQSLLNVARGDVASLCRSVSSMKTDREALCTTRGSIGQLDTPRFSRNLGEACASVSGGISAARVADIASTLIWKLEDSLTYKVGFIGGIFHTWRCEVVLQLQTRGFDGERETFAKMQADMQLAEQELKLKQEERAAKILMQWAHGDVKGLLMSCWRDWKHCVANSKNLKIQKSHVQAVANKWLIGDKKGRMILVWRGWIHQVEEGRRHADLERERQKYEEEMEKRDALIREKMDEIASREQDAKGNLQMVLAKWAKGSEKGLKTSTFQGWLRVWNDSREAKKKSAVVKRMANQWMEGEAKGLKRSIFQAWFLVSENGKELKAHNQQITEFLRSQHAKEIEEAARQANQQKMLHDKAIESAKLMVRKWVMGHLKALVVSVFAGWATFAEITAQTNRAKASVQVALRKHLQGDLSALLSIVFLNWMSDYQIAIQVRQCQGVLEETEVRWQSYMDTQRCEMELNAEMAKKEAARESCNFLVMQWMLGNVKGLLKNIFTGWHRYVTQTIVQDRSVESAKMVVERFLMGDRMGLLFAVLSSWHRLWQQEAFQRELDVQAQELEMAQEQLAVYVKKSKLHLMQYLTHLGSGSAETLLAMIVSKWRFYSQGERVAADHERQIEAVLREQELQQKSRDAALKAKKLQAMEMLGCKGARSTVMKFFNAWSSLASQERLDRDHRMGRDRRLEDFGLYLMSQWLKKSDAELLGFCFQEWYRARGHGFIEQLEQDKADLAEQLNLVYQQLSAVTDTLQKELKTKEELAHELREANEQMRKASFRAMHVSEEDLENSRLSLPWSSSSLLDVKSMRRVGSEGSLSIKNSNTPVQAKKLPRNSMPSSASTSFNFSSSRNRLFNDSPPSIKVNGVADEPRTSRNSSPSPNSANCTWDDAIRRMREEGRFRTGEAPRL